MICFVLMESFSNHESPRRGYSFVTRKICNYVCKIYLNKINKLTLGNLNAKRDWGYAKDYVVAMWKMLQKQTPKDYVIATGKSYSVRYFVEICFNYVGIDIVWEGHGVDEVGRDKKSKKIIVDIDPYYFRPTEVNHLQGDPSLAVEELGWKPKTNLKELVKLMMDEELRSLKKS